MKILVIGDGCKDVYQYGQCKRLSPEAPVPVFTPQSSKDNGGMAINVYNNLLSLGVDCDIITNTGSTKTRYVDEVSNQMLLRIDENDEVEPIVYEKLLTIEYDKYSAIVISDYDKGFLSDDDIWYISGKSSLVFLDTKKKIDKWAENVFCIKINKKEFDLNSDYLMKHFNGELVVTLGSKGANHWVNNYPIEDEHDVRDLSGAGDTFLAALVVKYLETKNIPESIKFANKCSSWVVTQKGVVSVDLKKIKL